MARGITNLTVVPANLVPGRSINVVEMKLNNFRIMCALQLLSTAQLAALEGQSNDQAGTMVPMEVMNHRKTWKAFKTEIEFIKTHNDPVRSKYDEKFKIFLPSGDELARAYNIKVKRVMMEIDRLMKILMSVDSASSQGNVSNQNLADIDKQVQTCEDALDIWWGTGVDNDNVGIEVGDYNHVHQLAPGVADAYSVIAEASADVTDNMLPDAPDTPAPRSGAV